MTKHILVQKDDINIFKAELDRLNKVNNVFATQTHINLVSEKLIYTGILFCKDT